MIRFDGVTFGYGLGKNVLQDFNLTVPDGARIWLCSPSGGGKTTVLRLLMGLEKPQKGGVTGCEKLRFSAVFQEDRLLPWKTAAENAAMFSDETAARAMLSRLGLREEADMRPAQLSGGMKRRVALARALCHDCDALVLDEPLTGLDAEMKKICLQAIEETVQNKTLVLTGHDASDAEFLRAETVTWQTNIPDTKHNFL
ncbi:MAG: ATP-binding cassette domain-containing protein [Eubacteriales bacterium]|nr:ATP-binding cassette domain-containing protein [Eubacteriales bacterium]